MSNQDILRKIEMALQVSLNAKGAVMLTKDGNIIHPLHPSPVCVEEIAHVLSNFCRYGGHCPDFYSVAQHSVLVSYLVSPELALEGLMHDAHEAYFGDWPKPIKNAVPGLVKVEREVESRVHKALGLRSSMDPAVKQADLLALRMEMQYLWLNMRPDNLDDWAALKLVTNIPPARARKLFLDRYKELTREDD